jgi:deoxyribodipyrimidine photo-lyase
MSSGACLVWFRRDLRLSDNPALHAAVVSGKLVVPLFIWSPDEEAPWSPGAASRWWLARSLAELARALEMRGSRLVLRKGPSFTALSDLVRETGADSIFWNRRYEPALMATDTRLAAALEARRLSVHTFNASLLDEPWAVRPSSGGPYRVFTPFLRENLARLTPPRPLAAPERVPAPAAQPRALRIEDLGIAAGAPRSLDDYWTPGEKSALARLAALPSLAAEYARSRDYPALQATSRLSPHLHAGEIGPRQIWHALGSQHGPGARAFRRQLVWREFAHHELHHFPGSPEEPLRPQFQRIPWRSDREGLAAWKEGRTGFPLVDAGMRELTSTGFMHNRVRMVAASFLVKHLLIDWREGARFYWQHLVDADLASNTLGWQWVAGSGADSAPFFRIMNPLLQAGKFDPDGRYVRRFVPEHGSAAYPPPIVDLSEARARALVVFESVRRAPADLRTNTAC